jgi:hypothetical protein
MKSTKRLLIVALAVAFFFTPVRGQLKRCKELPDKPKFRATVGLTERFVEKYKDRATVTTNFNVDKYPEEGAHAIADSGNDGDIHIAGRDDEIKLPLVVEIMNPRYLKISAFDVMEMLKGIPSGQAVGVTGVWRLWFEHPGKEQVMGRRVPVPADTNPAHLFEIHPVTKFNGEDTLASLIEIKAYKKSSTGEMKSYRAHSGSKTVPEYECIPSTILSKNNGITIASRKAEYNYTELVIELTGRPKEYEDCFIGLAHIYDSEEMEHRLTPEPRRMIFVKDSPPAAKMRDYSKGKVLRVLGIPRVSLKEVSAVAKQSGGKIEILYLPYEIIVAAVFEEE